MRRMSKKHSSLNQVASQFRIILADNMSTQFTGIFGHVVSGMEVMDKVGETGGENGKPEKIAAVIACGQLKWIRNSSNSKKKKKKDCSQRKKDKKYSILHNH